MGAAALAKPATQSVGRTGAEFKFFRIFAAA
jgi:hypothetical protein